MVRSDGEIMISFCTALFSFNYEKYSRGSLSCKASLCAGAHRRDKLELIFFLRHSITQMSTSTDGLKLDRF